MRDVPGIQAHAKTVIVWLTQQNITRKFQSRAEFQSKNLVGFDSDKVVRNYPINVFVLLQTHIVPQYSLRLAEAFEVYQYLYTC